MIKQVLSDAYRNCVKRFLLPTIFAVVSTLFVLYIIWASRLDNAFTFSAAIFLSLGSLLSLAFSLWKEEGIKPARAWSFYAVAMLAIIADVVYLYCTNAYSKTDVSGIFLGHLSVYLALQVAVWLISFFRSKDDVPAWNFALWLLVIPMATQTIGYVFSGGIMVLLKSLEGLFGIAVSENLLVSVFVIFGFLFPLLLFFGLIPAGERKHDYTPRFTGLVRKIVRYVFLPLEALYLLVLYAYALKILLTWQLPNGLVSWLVIVAFFGCVGIEVLLYPSRKKYDNRFDNLVAQYLPLLLLPLLLLMTVGICRRFSDYGITLARLYLALLNAWFYLVCLWLIVTRAKRFSFIPVTFVVLLMLSSVFPVNFTTITRQYLTRTIRTTLQNNGVEKLPIKFADFDATMRSIPKAEASKVAEKIEYLRDFYGSDMLDEFVESDERYLNLSNYIIKDEEAVETIIQESYNGYLDVNHLIIPEGSKEFTPVWFKSENVKAYTGTEILLPVEVDNKVVDSVKVDIAQFEKQNDNYNTPIVLDTKSENRKYLVTMFHVNGTSNPDTYNFEINGYLFSK